MAIIRPPFTGIHEILPNSGGNVPHEGGGRLQPYGEDLFQRVVDLNFGGSGIGGIFVSGDICCYVRTAKVPVPTLVQHWVGLGSLDFSDGGGNDGCTYANIKGRPTFLMCGGGPMINQNRDYEGIIMLSHNGVNWRNVFRTAANFNIYNDWVTEVAWDARDELFYANSSYSDNNGSSWISSDGYSWSYASGQSFWQHTNIVGWGDGIVGYDPEHNLLITPDDEVFQTISMYARCTAYMGGIWLAGGRNAFSGDSLTVSSIDSGKTWQPVTFGAIGMTGNYAITCIIGGPMEDFG